MLFVEGIPEVHGSLATRTLLQGFLRGFLIVPEIRTRNFLVEDFYLFYFFIDVKDNLEGGRCGGSNLQNFSSTQLTLSGPR